MDFLKGKLADAKTGVASGIQTAKGKVLDTVAPDPKKAGLSKIQDFIKNGMEVGFTGLLLMCGAIPFRYLPIPVAPLTSFGYAGLNLIVGGSLMWGGIKALVQGGILLASRFANLYYPSLWILRLATYFSPWFIYDIIQTLSPSFEQEGYRNPFTGATIAAEGGVGRINAISLPVIIGIFSTGLYAYMQYIPKELLGAAKPILDLVALGIGGVSALAAGGLGSMTVLPQLISGLKQSGSELTTAVAVTDPGAGAAPAAVAAATSQTGGVEAVPEPVAEPVPEQQGGGAVGSAIPSLREIANGMLGPSPGGGPSTFKSSILYGGGRAPPSVEEKEQSLFFLSLLGLTALGGLTLAVIRNKTYSMAQ